MADETCPQCGSALTNAPGYVGTSAEGFPISPVMECTKPSCGRFWGFRPNRPGMVVEAFGAHYDGD